MKAVIKPGKRDKTEPKKRLEFIIGAGVTASLGFPTWVSLVSQTVGRRLHLFDIQSKYDEIPEKETTKDLHKKILDCSAALVKQREGFEKGGSEAFDGCDMLEIAEYVLNSFKENIHGAQGKMVDDIANYKVTELVYDCLHMSEEDFKKRLDEKYKTSTIRAIVDVIKKSYEIFGYQEVLTYNYDNCIELCLDMCARIPKKEINTISYNDKEIVFKPHMINIAHVHGKVNIFDRGDNSDGIILAESSYRDMERTEYLWQNTVQAHAMLNNPSLFVGFSAQDYNFRRIIKNCENIENTFIIFTIDDIIRNVCKNDFKKFAREEMARGINAKRGIRRTKIRLEELDIDKIIRDNEDEFLKRIFKSKIDGFKNPDYDKYAYERLYITYIVKSQTDYWEKNNIKPIWTTIDGTPGLIRNIGNAYN